MTSTDTYQLKWHSHSSHLNGSVASLLRSERFTDVVLCTMDGSQIPAHKFILSSCSIYLSNLFDGQRSVMRMGNTMLYVVLPSEISTRALQILVEYMYKGETTVSNEVLDTVLKAGEVLKIRGLWRQTDVDNNGSSDATTVEKTVSSPNILNKQVVAPKKLDTAEATPKITVKKDEKLLKTFTPLQSQNITRPMFIGPPKLVFIKTSEGNTGLRPIAPKAGTQTIIVTPEISKALTMSTESEKSSMVTIAAQVETKTTESEAPTRVLRKIEKKYGKRSKSEKSHDNDDSSTERGNEVESEKQNDEGCGTKTDGKVTEITSAPTSSSPKIFIKDEPEWSDPTEDDLPIAEMFHTEMNIKSENEESNDISDEQMYSPLTCELCAEVFSVPAEWVRHIQSHAGATAHTRKRKHRSASDDTEETTALLRCDLCQKHFPNPAEWVRHIQSTHTESELAISNNSAPPKRHNRFTEGVQNKTCSQCSKSFPSHASMIIHMRTHTGERPFICGLCNKGFNVKSNLLRHLRTLHDQIISPGQVLDQEEVSSGDEASTSAPARIKLES